MMLTSGMFRLAELQIMHSLLRLSRVAVRDDVYVRPYETKIECIIDFNGIIVPFNAMPPAMDILDCFPKIKFMDTAEKIRKMSSLTIEYRDYYMNWIGRMQ